MNRARVIRLTFFAFAAFTIIALSLIARLPAASAANCSGTDHLMTVSVYSVGNVVNGAVVRFYLDPQLSRAADNLRTSGTEDAVVTTGANGTATLALYEGSYFVTITASGQQMLTTSVNMPSDGNCGAVSFSMTPAVVSGEFSTDKTIVTLSPTTIKADGIQTSTLTIQAFNQYGSIVPNLVAGLETTHEGMQINHLSTSTDATGKVSFILKGVVPGTALLTPTLNGSIFKTVILTLTLPTASTTSLTPSVSPTRSSVVVNGTPAIPNGTAAITVEVTALDDQGRPLVGRSVTVRTAISGLSVVPPAGTTDASGKAHFSLTSTQSGSSYLTVSVDGIALSDRPFLVFAAGIPTAPPNSSTTQPSQTTAAAGMLIKLPDDKNPATQQDSTVYYLGGDSKRHPFPNQKIFATWYTDFSSVHVIDAATMANLTLGAPVTYRPGMLLIKSPSSPKVYAVAGPNTLRWITSAEIATSLYGATWAARVQDLPDGFWTSYVVGTDVTTSAPFDPSYEQANALSIDRVFVP